MRRILRFTAAGVWLASALGLAIAAGPGDDSRTGSAQPIQVRLAIERGSCGGYGTSVEFVSTPSEAARQAKKEQKLVFVLHVSGHFEDPKFT